MILQTERLVLRHWEENDAESLFEYAKDPDVGPIAGWPPHQNVDESLYVIKNVFSRKEAYAVCLRSDGRAIGAVELKLKGTSDITDKDDESELGYWLAKPFWGRGIITEAAREMLRHAFEDIGMKKVWCGYYDGNLRSKRVQEKCGMTFCWTSENVDVPLMHEKRTGHVSCITAEEWRKNKASADLFAAMHPQFFQKEYVRAVPVGESFDEMVLALDEFDEHIYEKKFPDDVSFGYFSGDKARILDAVGKVSPGWIQYYENSDNIYCGFVGDEIASFCLVHEMGSYPLNGRNVRIGGPGCVGTVPVFRNRGIGLTMVRNASAILRDSGCDIGYIHYTAVAPWYEKLGYKTVLQWNRFGIVRAFPI